MVNKYTCLVLAAGKSSRFGSPKMQYVLANGLSVLQTTVQLYTQVFNDVVVVIKPQDSILKHSLADYSITVVESANAHLGLSQSIKSGVANIGADQGYLIALGDMPLIRLETLNMLKQAMMNDTAGTIIAPQMNARLGNPIAFSHTYREELLNLEGDVGAKKIIKHNNGNLIKVAVNDVGIFQDIDSIDDIPSILINT